MLIKDTTNKTGKILTHIATEGSTTTGKKIKVVALTPDEHLVFGQYQSGVQDNHPIFTNGQPIEMDGNHINWEKLTYNPPTGRTGTI